MLLLERVIVLVQPKQDYFFLSQRTHESKQKKIDETGPKKKKFQKKVISYEKK
jgi:hypothetical protein